MEVDLEYQQRVGHSQIVFLTASYFRYFESIADYHDQHDAFKIQLLIYSHLIYLYFSLILLYQLQGRHAQKYFANSFFYSERLHFLYCYQSTLILDPIDFQLNFNFDFRKLLNFNFYSIITIIVYLNFYDDFISLHSLMLPYLIIKFEINFRVSFKKSHQGFIDYQILILL